MSIFSYSLTNKSIFNQHSVLTFISFACSQCETLNDLEKKVFDVNQNFSKKGHFFTLGNPVVTKKTDYCAFQFHSPCSCPPENLLERKMPGIKVALRNKVGNVVFYLYFISLLICISHSYGI